ncbi:hypothetical protein EVAR_85534_1 [Eumeta japonica]|uniref:Uncharacterized protein n=1 Tax=Eumeta variegata TaxID=151549 RepID=A0A4C1VF49_EUMVA|nr:hypothetical protein EVAR_85534_1 [Eumeta japonica]
MSPLGQEGRETSRTPALCTRVVDLKTISHRLKPYRIFRMITRNNKKRSTLSFMLTAPDKCLSGKRELDAATSAGRRDLATSSDDTERVTNVIWFLSTVNNYGVSRLLRHIKPHVALCCTK